jgi:S-adenosylmethionine:tRNA ribosyltransferase-isomerase
MLRLTDFDYYLPKELIAQHPLKKRDAARLLVVERATGKFSDCVFSDIIQFFRPGDLIVLNDTKVLPCRLQGARLTGGKVEALLLNRKDGLRFNALLKPARLRLGEKIKFGSNGAFGVVSAKNEITFNAQDAESVYSLGVMPLPPYIKRLPQDADREDYQTVYAREEGAVASPTAGLHFTDELLKRIESAGIDIGYLTLHVGIGTFKPVKVDNILEHKMEAEEFVIPQATKDKLKKAKRVVAVGTTALRALESDAAGIAGSTNLFIYPGYKFKAADCLLTNFHLPKTTLFMLVCAFAGEELAKKAYAHAIAEKYRFYSYGDAMLIV